MIHDPLDFQRTPSVWRPVGVLGLPSPALWKVRNPPFPADPRQGATSNLRLCQRLGEQGSRGPRSCVPAEPRRRDGCLIRSFFMCETRRGSHGAPAEEREDRSPQRGQPLRASPRSPGPVPAGEPVGGAERPPPSGPGSLPVAGRLTGFAGVLCLTCVPLSPSLFRVSRIPRLGHMGSHSSPPRFRAEGTRLTPL